MSATNPPGATGRPAPMVLLAFVVAVLFAGSNAVAVRFTVDELAPFWGAFIRFAAAAAIFGAIMLVRHTSLPRGRTMWGVLLYGTLNFGVSYAFIYFAITEVTAGFTMVILALSPLLTFLLAVAHRLESFSWRALFGALLGLSGIAIAFASQAGAGGAPLWAVLFMVAGTICFSEATVILKMLPPVSPLAANGVGMGTAALLLVILSWVTGEAWSFPQQTDTRLAVAYLVIFGSVIMFYLVVYVIQHWTATASSYMLILAPFVTVPLGAWLADETITPGLIVGGIIVLAGVWFGALATHDQPQPGPSTTGQTGDKAVGPPPGTPGP